MTGEPVLRATGLAKDYGPVRVVADMDLTLHRASIHALMGENGAGKSTVIKMLSGAAKSTEGTMTLGQQPYTPASVHEAQQAGVVALPQEIVLVPSLTVADNVFLGLAAHSRAGVLQRGEQRRIASEVLDRLGQRLPMSVPVGELSPVQQTMVALARALVRQARVLILDEPTAALTDAEIEQLFEVLRGLRDAGTSILYVSHRMEEVFALSDTVTVMRNGSLVWTKPIGELDQPAVVAAMIGRESQPHELTRRNRDTHVVLEVERLSGRRLTDVSFSVTRGMVLGVAGLAGSGRSELLRTLAGAQRARHGNIRFEGVDLTHASIREHMRHGVALVPEERRKQALMLGNSIAENIALANLSRVSRAAVVNNRLVRTVAEQAMSALRIRATSITQVVGELSGGNQQKVVLGKYLEGEPRLLLLDEPTRGIDVGTKEEIHALVDRLAGDGMTVVVVSSEIPELLRMSDEIVVLREGRVTARLIATEADEETILTHCYRMPEEQ